MLVPAPDQMQWSWIIMYQFHLQNLICYLQNKSIGRFLYDGNFSV